MSGTTGPARGDGTGPGRWRRAARGFAGPGRHTVASWYGADECTCDVEPVDEWEDDEDA